MSNEESFFHKNNEFWEKQAKPYFESLGIQLIEPDEVNFDIGDLNSISFPVTYFEISTEYGSLEDDQVKAFVDLLELWDVTRLFCGFGRNGAWCERLFGPKPARAYGDYYRIFQYCYFVKDGGLYCLAFATSQEKTTAQEMQTAKALTKTK